MSREESLGDGPWTLSGIKARPLAAHPRPELVGAPRPGV